MTSPARLGVVCAALALLCPGSPRADEAADLTKKQQDAVEAALKKLDLPKPGKAEAKHLRVVTTLSAEKAKLMGEAADRFYVAAAPLLKFEGDEKPWPGKLTVYAFAERSEFTNFLRTVEMRRPDAEDQDSLALRGDVPHLAMFLAKEVKDAPPPEAQVGPIVAEALLRAKAGSTATVPTWMREGFSRAIRWKLDPRLAAADKTQVRKLLADGKKGFVAPKGWTGVKVADLWGEERDAKDREKLAASLIEYMATGPDAAKFGPALASLRPSEENQKPTFDAVMKSAGKEKAEDLETAWKAWVIRGK